MPRKEKTPWLEYEGQDTAEILSYKSTHRIASLLCALEQALNLRRTNKPQLAATPEEQTLLAVMALQREVNNGGYSQFFFNSSRQYASSIVTTLKQIGCETTAALTQRAIDALGPVALDPDSLRHSISQANPSRDQALDELDQQFYRLSEIDANLFAFVESHREAFVLEKVTLPPRPPKRGNHNLIHLGLGLDLAPQPELNFESVRKLTSEVAVKKEVQASEAELDGSAYHFLFRTFLKAGDLEQCEKFAGPAFDLTREDTGHCLTQRKWVEKLIELSNFARADEVTLQYLEYLSQDDTSIDFIKNRIKYWSDILRGREASLPKSAAFFRATFPQVDLSAPSTAPRIFRAGPPIKAV
jgi:Domain of unknown function (DUF4375)